MKTNYLVGLNKQLQYAVDNGLQEAYEFGLLVNDCLDLVEPQEEDDVEDDLDDARQGDSSGVASSHTLARESSGEGPHGPAPRSGDELRETTRVPGMRPCLVQRTADVRSGPLAGAMGGTPEGLQSALAGVKPRKEPRRGTRR